MLKRYSQYYDTKTLKMYMSGNRQQRQWIIMAAKELELMPTTEGGLDFKLDLTHAMDGYPGVEHALPIAPLYDDVVQLFKATQTTNTPDAAGVVRRAVRRELLLHERERARRSQDPRLHAGGSAGLRRPGAEARARWQPRTGRLVRR